MRIRKIQRMIQHPTVRSPSWKRIAAEQFVPQWRESHAAESQREFASDLRCGRRRRDGDPVRPSGRRSVPCSGRVGRCPVAFEARAERGGANGAAPPWLTGALAQRPEPGPQGWAEVFQSWLNGLPLAPDLAPVSFRAGAGIVVVPPPVLAPAPAYPVGVYGHVPFQGTTQANDRFCRFEAWPTSRRVNTPVGQVAPGTFAGPWSEDQFIACGFGAVARFALPCLLPACFRWELEVGPGTPVKCGAAIPLFGQSGGGVEVELVGPPSKKKFIRCVSAVQTTIPAI